MKPKIFALFVALNTVTFNICQAAPTAKPAKLSLKTVPKKGNAAKPKASAAPKASAPAAPKPVNPIENEPDGVDAGLAGPVFIDDVTRNDSES